MIGDESINEEMAVAEERAYEGRRVLDRMMIREPILQLDPRQPAVCVEEGEVVQAAIERMQAHGIGSVLVTRGPWLGYAGRRGT